MKISYQITILSWTLLANMISVESFNCSLVGEGNKVVEDIEININD